MWNCIFGSFKLFPNTKNDFWPFLKLQKMEFGQKNYSWNSFIWFHEFFCLDFFIFSGPLCQQEDIFKKNTNICQKIITSIMQIDEGQHEILKISVHSWHVAQLLRFYDKMLARRTFKPRKISCKMFFLYEEVVGIAQWFK